jgi:magnesium-transporting ATPase (P-type)/class 3 adenylate cyclase
MLGGTVVEGVRKICLGGESSAEENNKQEFNSNYVSTTKYELWNIVPKNLLEQFQRAANFWFLTVSVFQMLPLDVSPTNKYATILPLCGVIFVTFCKDAWEDQLRRRDDKRVNNQRCTVVEGTPQNPQFRSIRWKDVTVGSLLQLERDSPVPADMILLSSSNEDGVAFVDTAQLDGETSLKPKFPLEETMRMTEPREVLNLEGHIDSEMPNELVQTFSGTLFLRGHPRGIPIDAKNFLLRGSTLRNTQCVYGVVNFTGVDTKLVQNSKPTPSKRSHVEVLANRLLLIVFAVLVTTAVVSALVGGIWLADGSTGSIQRDWVYPEDDKVQDNRYLTIITFMIGYNNLIPISLYVTTDLVRTLQGLLMERDADMYHAGTDSFCRVRNSGLCENLGQVEFVLSDKTGTLTENKMSFKACCIGDRVYGFWDEDKGPVNHVVALPPSDICVPLDKRLWGVSKPCRNSEKSHTLYQRVDDFFLCLAACHTAIVEDLPMANNSLTGGGGSPFGQLGAAMQTAAGAALQANGSRRNSGSNSRRSSRMGSAQGSQKLGDEYRRNNSNPTNSQCMSAYAQRAETALPAPELLEEAQRITFRSSSPDEEALVAAARDHGYFFRKKKGSSLVINVRGKDTVYTVRTMNEFSSERKRMSVLVQKVDVEGGSSSQDAPAAVLYVKGADNVMLERLLEDSDKTKAAAMIKGQLKRFASCGLRTLVLAKREITVAQADIFVQKMHEAKTALMYRERMVEEVADEMERNLQYLGITAIEDKIQQGVPKTINMLLRAGIKVWMLTGDNMETAINIGIACSLTNSEMQRWTLDAPNSAAEKDPDAVERKLEEIYKEISRRLNRIKIEGPFHYTLVVHGSMLYVIDDHDRLRQLFLAIACSSSSVIACRLAPAQKAALVKLVRSKLEGSPLTLAIGDGGNDVSMIQEAHVGVGILGVEGRQAANASDFVIAQFRFLQQLLLVHGRGNLRRIGVVIGYSFYKNFTLVLPMVFYALYTGFSGTTLYDSYLLSSFNLFFTSLPILVMGVFDRDVSAKMALLVPSLYQLGIKRCYFNSWMLISWIARGALHAVFVFFGVKVLFQGSMATPGGDVPDYLTMGSWGYWACVVVVNVTMLLQTKAWMDWYVFLIAGSSVIFIPMLLLYSQGDYAKILNEEMVGVGHCLFGRLGSWIGMLLIVSASSLSDLAILFARKVFYPDAADILQEVQLGYLSGIGAGPLAKGEEDGVTGFLQTDASPTFSPSLQASGDKDDSKKDKTDDNCSDAGFTNFGDDSDEENGRNSPNKKGKWERQRSTYSDMPDPEVPPEYSAYLKQLPVPPARLYQVKPIGNLYLEPLMPATARQMTSHQAKSSWPFFSSPFSSSGMSAVVPASPVQSQGSSSSTWSETASIKIFTERQQGFAGRTIQCVQEIYDHAWQKQWCKMTVGDLLASLGRQEYNQMLDSKQSKHFKTGIDGQQEASKATKVDRGAGNSSSTERDSKTPQIPGNPPIEGAPVSRGDASFTHTNSCASGPLISASNSCATTATGPQEVGTARTVSIDTQETGVVKDVSTTNASMGSQVSISAMHTEVVGTKDLIYSIISLRFLSPQQEASFRQYFSSQALAMFQKSIIILAAALLLYNVYGAIVYHSEKPLMLRVVTGGMIIVAGAVSSYFLHTGFVRSHIEFCIIGFILAIIAVKHCYDVTTDETGILANSYLPVFMLAGARIRITAVGPVLLVHMAALLIHYWIASDLFGLEIKSDFPVLDDFEIFQQAEFFVLMIGIASLSFANAYLIEKLMRQDFIVLFSLERSKKQAMEILRNMFPEAVVNHVINDIQRRQEASRTGGHRKSLTEMSSTEVKSIREDCGIVTVLFCDVMDFEGLVESLDPRELVTLLDQVWQAFDRVCQTQQLQKIETVGKTYMAAAMNESSPATDTANGVIHAVLMALDMLELVEKRVLGVSKSVSNVSVKIGIHTGNAMCGVVGSRKPQFALFGDTVNTASRMTSTGQKNHVHVSSQTYQHVKDDPRFSWEQRNTFVKGKGNLDTYLLVDYQKKRRRRSTSGTRTSQVEKSAVSPTPSSEEGSASGGTTSGPLLQLSGPSVVKSVSWGKRSNDKDAQGSKSPRRGSGGRAGEAPKSNLSPPSPAEPAPVSPEKPKEGPPPLPTSDEDDDDQSGFADDSSHEPSLSPDLPASPPRGSSGGDKPVSSISGTSTGMTFQRRLSEGISRFVGTDKQPDKDKDKAKGAPVTAARDPKEALENDELPQAKKRITMLEQQVPTATSKTMKKRKLAIEGALRNQKLFRRVNGDVRDKTQQEIALNSQDMKSILVSLQCFSACYAAESFCLLVGRQGRESDHRSVILAVRGGYFAISLLGSMVLFRHARRLKWGLRFSKLSTFFSDLCSLIIFGGFVASTVSNVAFLPDGSEFWNVFEAFFFVMVLMHMYRLNLQGVLPVCLCVVVIIVTVAATAAKNETVLMLECIVYSLLMSGTQMLAVQGDPRRSRVAHRSICEEHDRVNELLDSMLPRELLLDMKLGTLNTAYTYNDMTFLFADIVGFTSYCASHNAEEAVNLVTRLFSEFDDATLELGIYKVCTIGDAYVVVNEPRTKGTEKSDKFGDCERVYRLAAKMIQIIIRVRDQVQHDSLDMRIGLHCGNFVGGVIGTTRVRFDIWGQDVIIGNTVESEGKAGRICASEQAKQTLESCAIGSKLTFTFNKEFELKNKRTVLTYVVESSEDMSS